MDLFNAPVNDMGIGREALIKFHNASTAYPDYAGISFDQMLKAVSRNHPDIFLDGLGGAIREIGMRDSKVSDAMVTLASQAKGKMPNQNAFFSALSQSAQNLTFTDYMLESPTIVKNIAVDLGEGAKQIGDAVIDTGKSLTTILPLVIVGAVIFVIVMKSKKYAA